MADFKPYFEKEKVAEGVEYENDAEDECTKFGIVVDDLNRFYAFNSFHTCNDIKGLEEDEAGKILKKLYWDFFMADKINNQLLAEFIVDSGLLNGKVLIAKAIQEIVGTLPDGKVGIKTLEAINNYDAIRLYDRLYGYRLRKFDEIKAANLKYYNGWINRLNTIKVDV